ncbi:MAG: rhomboid family intramembrane serine protease [Eubacteriales bacterium]|nr:rhomboid family intramembrane serine protease [Eubacteriales bacterium]
MEKTKHRQHIVTYSLIGLNIIYFLFLSMLGDTETDIDMMIKYGAMYEPLLLEKGEYFRLLSSCFMHFGIEHLVSNMLVLFLMGDNLERYLGHIKFLILYIASGIIGNVVSLYYHNIIGEFVVSAGASGAVFGVSGAILWILMRNKGQLDELSLNRILLMIGMNIYIGVTGSGVDNAAHIGGLLSGFILAVLFYRMPKKRSRGEWDYM